ncbi:MAG TPA: TetR/AcrR family transcriptional regulator [Clostridia bacterium]|nr:TetR/AcrR family transcriptional regulator [Clostridia bacterium]
MPLQLYDKEKILDACLSVFARYGYENTSVAMLAEAAGISKALIFHHFKSKKELYLNILDQCFEKGRMELGVDVLPEARDFFEAREKFSIIKFEYYKRNPDVYKLAKEAFYATPEELKAEIEEKYGAMIANKDEVWEQLFEKVPLREGVNRAQAYELVMLIMDYFEKKYFSDWMNEYNLDDEYLKRFIKERNSFFAMIRYGIEK